MKRSMLTLGLVVTALSACGNGSLSGGGTAGVGGTAGTTGTTGAAGTGAGAIGGHGDCVGPASADYVEVRLVGADGLVVATPARDAVTVTSIGTCGATCEAPCQANPPAICSYASPDTPAIGLAGTSQQWTLYLRDTAMPPDFIKLGDRFDLVADVEYDNSTPLQTFPFINQTVALSRDGKLILLAAYRSQFAAAPVVNLQAFGVTIADGRTACAPPSACFAVLHDALVTVGSESVFVANGQSATVGGLRFTNSAFKEYRTGCLETAPSQAVMAAFRLP